MAELGVYGVGRVCRPVFAGPGGVPDDAQRALVALGAVSAVVGTLMCRQQPHVKRLPAFSTVAHTGLFPVGLGLLTPDSTEGIAPRGWAGRSPRSRRAVGDRALRARVRGHRGSGAAGRRPGLLRPWAAPGGRPDVRDEGRRGGTRVPRQPGTAAGHHAGRTHRAAVLRTRGGARPRQRRGGRAARPTRRCPAPPQAHPTGRRPVCCLACWPLPWPSRRRTTPYAGDRAGAPRFLTGQDPCGGCARGTSATM